MLTLCSAGRLISRSFEGRDARLQVSGTLRLRKPQSVKGAYEFAEALLRGFLFFEAQVTLSNRHWKYGEVPVNFFSVANCTRKFH